MGVEEETDTQARSLRKMKICRHAPLVVQHLILDFRKMREVIELAGERAEAENALNVLQPAKRDICCAAKSCAYIRRFFCFMRHD